MAQARHEPEAKAREELTLLAEARPPGRRRSSFPGSAWECLIRRSASSGRGTLSAEDAEVRDGIPTRRVGTSTKPWAMIGRPSGAEKVMNVNVLILIERYWV